MKRKSLLTSDVFIAGVGPAGASLAFGLASKGVSVSAIEGVTAAPAGETLPPQARRVIPRLGISLESLSGAAMDSFGIESRWGGQEQFHSHVMDADGNAWHIDRSAFASQLRELAISRGVSVSENTLLLGATRSRDAWTLTLRKNGQSRDVRCRYLVDASGRATAIGRKLGAIRLRFDRLCAVTAVVERGSLEQTLAVESCEYGWWYAAPFSSSRAIVALMSDVDILQGLGALRSATWVDLFRHTELHERVNVKAFAALQAFPCETSRLTENDVDGWIAIGDAASVLDPLASAGVLKAMIDGHVVAGAIHAYLSSGSTALLREHARQAGNEFQRYLSGRQIQYRSERRWKHSPFWSRRIN